MQRVSQQLSSLIELKQRHVRRLWQRTLVLAAIAIALAHVQHRPEASSLEYPIVLVIAVLTFGAPHVLIRLGLNGDRMVRLQNEAIDPARFPSEEEKIVRITSSPIPFGLRFRQPVTRSLVESLPEHERPVVRAIETVERWNVGRLWALLICGAFLTLFLNGAALGVAALIVPLGWILTLVASYPTIESWLAPPAAG